MLSTAECQRQKLLRRPSLGTEARPHIPQRAAEQILQRLVAHNHVTTRAAKETNHGREIENRASES